MTWEELTSQEKTAVRHLAKGEVQEVPWRQIRRLRELGLSDDNPEGRLTPGRAGTLADEADANRPLEVIALYEAFGPRIGLVRARPLLSGTCCSCGRMRHSTRRKRAPL